MNFFQPSKRSPLDLAGRNDGNTKVIFPQTEIPDLFSTSQHTREIKPGDYVAVQVSFPALPHTYTPEIQF